jgi:hypothetical protein
MRGKRVFTVRSRFAKDDVVFQKGVSVPLTVTGISISIGYETDDDRFFSADELRLAPRNYRGKAPEQKKEKEMLLTYGQIGDLIDALQFAVRARQEYLRTKFSLLALKDRGRHLEPNEKEKYVEWTAQIRRYRNLRRYLLQAEEKANLPKRKRSRSC